MADLENIESLTVQATLDDKVTAPSNNMTGALDKVAGGVERVTEKLSRARPGLESTGRLVDTQTNLLLRQQQVMERYEARQQALTTLYQKQGRSAEELAEGIRRLGVLRDQDIRKSEDAARKREDLFNPRSVEAYARALREANEMARALSGANMLPAGTDQAFGGAAAVSGLRTELERMRASIDPVFAASKRYEAAMDDLATKADTLGLNVKQVGLAMRQINADYEAALRPMKEINDQLDRQQKAESDAAAAIDRARAVLIPGYEASMRYARAKEEIEKAAELLGQRGLPAEEAALERLRQEYEAASPAVQKLKREQQEMAEAAEKAAKSARDNADAMERERMAIDPLYAASRRYEQQLERVNALQAKGGLSAPRADALRNQITSEFAAANKPLEDFGKKVDETGKKVGNSFNFQRQQMINFFQQVQDFGVQVASGSGLFYPLVQQVPQALSAFGSISDGLARVRDMVLSLRGGLVLGTAAFVGLGYIINSRIGDMDALAVRMRGFGDDATKMARDLDEAAQRAAKLTPGVGAGEARGMAEALIRGAAANRFTGTVDSVQLVQDTANLAARVGSTVNEAFARITQGMKDPVALLDTLVKDRLVPLDAAFRANIQSMVSMGDRGKAFAAVMNSVRDSLKGASQDALSPMGKVVEDLKNTYGGFWHDLQNALETTGREFLSWLTRVQRAQNELGKNDDISGWNGHSLLGYGLRRLMPGMFTDTADPATLPTNRTQSTGLLGLIQSREGGINNATAYNTFTGYVKGSNGAEWRSPNPVVPGLENMTLQQVYGRGMMMRQAQEAAGIPFGETSSAAGAFQITGSTMQEFARRLGIGMGEKFSAEIQQRLAQGIVDDARNRSGGSQDEFLRLLRGRWTGLKGVSDEQIIQSLSVTTDKATVETSSSVAVTGENGAAAPTDRGAPGIGIRNGVFQPLNEGNISDWERLQRILQDMDGYRPRMTSDEGKRDELPAYIDAIQRGLNAAPPGTDQDQLDKALARLREYKTALEATHDPLQRMIEDQERRAAAAETEAAGQAALNDRLREFDRSVRERGREGELTDADRERFRQALSREISAPIKVSVDDTDRAIRAQKALADAYERGGDAIGHAANVEKAADLVRRSGTGTDRQRAETVAALAAKYDELARATNDANARQFTQQQRDEIALMQREGQLLGESVSVRNEELAVLRERQRMMNAPGGTSEPEMARAEAAIRANQRVRNDLDRQKAAYDEVANFGTQAFDRIGEAITQSFILGEDRAVKFKDVVRSVISEMTQWLLKLAVMNPLKNWLTGSNLPNLFDVGTAIFGGGAGGGGGIGGGGLGSILGGVGSFFGLGGAGGNGIGQSIQQASGAIQTWTSLMGDATNAALGNMGGQYGPATAAQVQAAGGPGLMGYGQQAMQMYGLYNQLSGGGSGGLFKGVSSIFGGRGPGIMSGGYDWASNSIVSGVDSFLGTGIGNWLNTPLYSAPLSTGLAASSAANLSANGFNYVGGAAMGEVGTSTVAGAGGMGTIGSAAAGVAGVAAGAYGTYQGIKRGGIGGYTSAAGSAAMGAMSGYAALAGTMSAVPVYGWIAAAALMVVGALLPGQKPSDRTGTFTANTLEGVEVGQEGGLTGKKFSQENRDQARAVAGTLQQIANKIGSAAGLPGAANATFRVEVGARDGLKVALDDRMLQGNLDEEGIKSVTDAWTSVMLQKAAEQTSDPLMARVINASGTGDPEKTLGNMQWYQDTYRQLANPNEFERNRMEITRKWQEGIDKAVELSLPTEALVSRRDVELRQLEERRGADEASARADLRDRTFADRGGVRGADQIASEAARAEANRIRGRIDLENQLSSLGLTGGAADEFRQLLAEAEAAEERLRVRTLGRTQEDLAYNQTTSGMSAELRLRQAQGAAGDQAALRQVEDTNFAVQASRSLVELRRSLEDLGFSAEAIAGQMGLATQAIEVERANLSRQQARRVEDIALQSATAGASQWQRYYSALGARTGNPGYGNEAERLGFESNAQQGIVQLRRSLEDLGWSSQAIAEQIGLASQAIDIERQNLQRTQARRNEDYSLQLQAAGLNPWIQRYTALGQQQGFNVGYANEAERLQFEMNAGQSIIQLRRSLEDLGVSTVDIARQVEMATGTINIERENLQRTQQRRVEDYYQNVGNLRVGLDVRQMRATGRTDEAALMEFDWNAQQERLNLSRQLFDLGFSAQETAARLAQFGDIIAEERQSVIDQIRDQRASTALGPIEALANYAQGLRYGDASPLSVQDQLAAAQKSFAETASKAVGGDFASIQGLQSASDTYLQLAREVYGSGSDYITAFTRVTDALESVGNMTVDTLTAAVYVAEQRSGVEQLVAALERVREEVALSREETLQASRAPDRVKQ